MDEPNVGFRYELFNISVYLSCVIHCRVGSHLTYSCKLGGLWEVFNIGVSYYSLSQIVSVVSVVSVVS